MPQPRGSRPSSVTLDSLSSRTQRRMGDGRSSGWPIGAMGEEVAAIVVPEKTIEEAALIEFCKSQLASYKIPRRIFFIEQMPRNEAGKVNKQRLMRSLPEQLEGQVKSFE
jgi:acyl-CoA synthetase (AMP-forming)/AMP-acid ligase II